MVFVPASGIDFASSLVSGNSEIRPSTLSEYSLSPDSFSDPLSKLGNRNRSLTAPGPKKLEFSGFSKGDSVFVSFGSYVRYKVSGEFENARDDALSDNAVLDSNGFVNVVTDQSNVNGSFSR